MAGLRAKPYAPSEADWQKARAHWAELHSDAGAVFDAEIKMDASKLAPMVTWGTSPEHAAPCGGRAGAGPARALHYMGLEGGERLADLPLQGAFIGSCTNGRLSDLRAAALYLRGARVAPSVRAVCVPGSQSVRRAAEAEGLDQVFRQAGFEWGEPGCAMCFYAGGQTFPEGARVISSTNRNFEGRQGPGVRTHLASPATVAASAVAGRITDPRMAERHARAA
jgi:3-isopropylmalate/(R)-2-methylmalate dehydratase large subunit